MTCHGATIADQSSANTQARLPIVTACPQTESVTILASWTGKMYSARGLLLVTMVRGGAIS